MIFENTTVFFGLSWDIYRQIIEYFNPPFVFCIPAMTGVSAFPYLASRILHIHYFLVPMDVDMTKSLLERDRPRLFHITHCNPR